MTSLIHPAASTYIPGPLIPLDQPVVFERYLEDAADVIITAWSAHLAVN